VNSNNTLPLEVVDIDVINEKSKYLEGCVKSFIEKSDKRINVKCPYFSLCGGCNIMHMSYSDQLNFKKEKVENILFRFAKLKNVVKEIIPTSEFNYRNKVTLKVKDGRIGYFKNKSYDLINIDKCLLCNNKINKVIKILSKLDLKGINEVVIRSNYKEETLVYLLGNILDYDYLIDNLKDCDNIVINNYKDVKILKGNDYFIEKIGNYSFRVSYNSFFQINDKVSILYDVVKKYASLTNKENVLDLYCGTGTIGIYLSEFAKKVIGIEINKNAVNDANFNKKLNSIQNIEFLCTDANLIKKKYKNIDLVIVDPPRSGLGKGIYNIFDINPKKIIYVSCDPVTLARDLNILKEKYEIKEVTLVDMFCNTYHVECVCLLMKK